MARVLVCNAHARHALAAVRSLGRAGHRVTAASAARVNAGGWSRYADRRLHHPHPVRDPVGFLDALERELRRGDYDLLLPVNGRTVETVVRARDRFDPLVGLPFLPPDRLAVGFDERRTVRAARRVGTPRPETLLPTEVTPGAVDALGYPVVVKPCRGSGRDGVVVCESRAAFERTYDRVRSAHGPALVQSFVPRRDERGVYTVYDDGELVALSVQRRLRSAPPAGGASTYRETVRDSALAARADRLLSSLDWHGAAMVEFRVDDRDGTPQLIEINPRLWGSLALTVAAGVDVPATLLALATGESVEPRLDYEVGVRCRRLFADAVHVADRTDRLAALREFVAATRERPSYDVLSRDDPFPTLGCLGRVVGATADRVRFVLRDQTPEPPTDVH
jgi:predicted ATP-grasp superfamily ATP-dependent carboligase